MLVAVLTVGALWLRAVGLADWDGTLSIDEARLALAGRGVVEHGLPVLPSGWVYTRGLLASYGTALSFILFGQSDFAARLPSVVAGAALVPVAYLLGRSVAGTIGGLFVAAYVAGHASLVVWSRQAWLYAPYTLLYTLALFFIIRAHQTRRDRDQLIAGGAVGLTFFCHEMGVLLVLPLAAQIAARLWAGRKSLRCCRAQLASLAVVAFAAALLWGIVTSLRAETLIGPYGELLEYFSPHVESASFRFYLKMLVDGSGLVLALALLGLPRAIARRRYEVLILWLALLPPFLYAALIIPRAPQERYGLTMLVVTAALAAESAVSWAVWLRNRWPRLRVQGILAGVALIGVVLVHQGVGEAIERGALSTRDGAWLSAVRSLSIGPEDLVMSDLPTVMGWYVGGLDYWLSSRDFQKYTVPDGQLRRDVHTGALLVRNAADLRQLALESHHGRSLWVVGSGRSYQWGELVDDDFKAFLRDAADQRVDSRDNSRIYRIELGEALDKRAGKR